MAKVARERALQVQEKAQIKAQQLEYDTKFNAYVDEVDAAAQARQADFEARKKEQNVNARLVLEEQIRERQVGAIDLCMRLDGEIGPELWGKLTDL